MFENLNFIYSIFVIIYGLSLGAVSTTFWNRIPYRRKIGPGYKPECNKCRNEICFPYFLPIIGFILTKGECFNNQCKMKIPLYYLFIELSIPILTFLLSLKYLFYTEEFLLGSIFSTYMFLSIMMIIKNRKMNIHFIWFGICISFLFGFFTYSMELDEILIHIFLRVITLLYIDKKRRYFGSISSLFVILAVTVSPKLDIIFLSSVISLKLILKILEMNKMIGKYYKMKVMKLYLFLYHYVALFI